MVNNVILYKDGKEDSILKAGIYNSSRISGFEKVVIPEKVGFVLFGNPDNANALDVYENESYIVDAKVEKYTKLLVLDLSDADLSLLNLRNNKLSDSELLSVVGGTDNDFALGSSCKVYECPLYHPHE